MGFYLVIFSPYSAQIPIVGEDQLKLLVSKPSGLQTENSIDKLISVAVWNEDSLSLSPWEAEVDVKCRGERFL